MGVLDDNETQVLLSPRELEVITMMAAGSMLPEICQELGLTISTVKTHIKHARKKYQLVGRDAGTAIRLIRCVIEDGLVPPIVALEVK